MPPKSTKVVSLRMPTDLADKLELAAKSEGVSMNQFVLRAIDSWVENKLRDPEFRAKLQAEIDRLALLLKREG